MGFGLTNTMSKDNANDIYKQLLKRVHPDLHPDMPDATRKTQELNKAKKDLDRLLRLGVKWKLLPETMLPKKPKKIEPDWAKIRFMGKGYDIFKDEEMADKYVKEYVKRKYGINLD
jgi:hypothetical protein